MAERTADRDSPFPDLPIDAFLDGHMGPWPRPSRDHPFGLAPAIYKIPDEEWADWNKYVGSYYRDNVAQFGVKAAALSIKSGVGLQRRRIVRGALRHQELGAPASA